MSSIFQSIFQVNLSLAKSLLLLPPIKPKMIKKYLAVYVDSARYLSTSN